MNRQFNLGDISPYTYFFSISTLLGLMLAFVAPDDNLAHGWLVHLMHWEIQTIVPTFLAILIHRTIGKILSHRPMLSLALSGFISAAVFSPIALLSDLIFTSQERQLMWHQEITQEFMSIAPPIVIFWIAINVPFQLGWQLKHHPNTRPTDSQSSINDTARGAEQAEFIQLLPSSIGHDLIYIKSELHYLKVVTVDGSAMILYSLNSAVSELAHLAASDKTNKGLQVHRSFWVKNSHIKQLQKRNREGVITMSNGDTIPVSRARMKAVLAEVQLN